MEQLTDREKEILQKAREHLEDEENNPSVVEAAEICDCTVEELFKATDKLRPKLAEDNGVAMRAPVDWTKLEE